MHLNRASQITEFNKSDVRVKKLMSAMSAHHRRPDALIEILHTAHDLYGYLPLNLLSYISKELKVSPSKIYGVVTFYHFFSLKPKGEHNCLICTGTACYVKGSQAILEAVEKEYLIKAGETTRDNCLSLQTVRCIGTCGLAPAAVLDNENLAKITPDAMIDLLHKKIGEVNEHSKT